MGEYIREKDIQAAIERLSFLSTRFRRQFFGRPRLDRLERIAGTPIDPDEILELIVRTEGSELLARRRRRIGKSKTSVRMKLLQTLDEDSLRAGRRAKCSCDLGLQKRELLDQLCDAVEQLWPSRSEGSGSSLGVFRYLEGESFDSDLPPQPTLIVGTAQNIGG